MSFDVNLVLFVLLATNACGYGKQFASVPNTKCMPGFNIEWVKELGTSPFAATPLVADMNADGSLEIVTVSFAGDVNVISANNGNVLGETKWPYMLSESTIHSSPIHYDFDRDGMLDVLIFTSQGEIFILSWDGRLIKQDKLSGLPVKIKWYEEILIAEEKNIHDFIEDTPTGQPEHILVDPHILATPALVDLNRDGVVEEFVIPISYYFDLEYYNNPEAFSRLDPRLSYSDLKNYLASSLIILNGTDLSVTHTIHMELTKVDAEFPGYQLFSPTAVDLDGHGGPLVIVTGSSAGHLHVFSTDGSDRAGFPVPTDSIHGQVAVEDVTQDGSLDLIMADVSGNVACYDTTGKLHWETETSGTKPSAARVADLRGDGELQVIVTADDGLVWVLDGKTGAVLADWPFRIRGSLSSPPLLSKIESLENPAIMVLDSNGFLHVLGEANCRHAVTLRETSLVSIVSHDLVPSNQGLEYLVSCKDGAVICLSQTNQTGLLQDEPANQDEDPEHYAWPGDTRSVNDFLYGKFGIKVDWSEVADSQVIGSSFSLTVTVIDKRVPTHPGYTVTVSVGSIPLLVTHIERALEPTVISVESPDRPLRGHLIVRCHDRHGKVVERIQRVSFHQTIGQDLLWLLVAPTVMMGILLLFMYGFPSEELLPSYHHAKTK